jgi:hypothetical protein
MTTLNILTLKGNRMGRIKVLKEDQIRHQKSLDLYTKRKKLVNPFDNHRDSFEASTQTFKGNARREDTDTCEGKSESFVENSIMPFERYVKSIAIKKARKNNLLSMNKQNLNSSNKRVSKFQLKTVRSKRNLEEIKNKCIKIKQQKLDITNATNFVEFKSMKRLTTIRDFVQQDVAKRTDRLMRNHSKRILKNKRGDPL